MKKFVLLLALCSSAIASAPSVRLLETTMRGGISRTWVLLDNKVPNAGGALSHKVLFEVNCREATARMMQLSYAQSGGEGAVLSKADFGAWEPTVPGTVPHDIQRRTCK